MNQKKYNSGKNSRSHNKKQAPFKRYALKKEFDIHFKLEIKILCKLECIMPCRSKEIVFIVVNNERLKKKAARICGFFYGRDGQSRTDDPLRVEQVL